MIFLHPPSRRGGPPKIYDARDARLRSIYRYDRNTAIDTNSTNESSLFRACRRRIYRAVGRFKNYIADGCLFECDIEEERINRPTGR